MTTPQELKAIVSEGLLSFPVTDFDQNGDESVLVQRLRVVGSDGGETED